MSEEKSTTAASAFASLGTFKAKPVVEVAEVDKAIQKDIDAVAEKNNFYSREARPQASNPERFNSAKPKKQLNIRIDLDLHARYYATAKRRGNAILGDLLSDALDALDAAEAAEKQKD